MRGVFLGLGSNLGDRDANLAAARAALAGAAAPILSASRVRETEPFGVRDQPRFLNQVVEVSWAAGPRDLLRTVKGLEAELGRRPDRRWGPRLIDIDILVFGDLVLDDPDLVIPHAGLERRRFVLEPLAELNSELVEPRSSTSVRDLLSRLEVGGG